MQPFLGTYVHQDMSALRAVLLLALVALPSRAEPLWFHLQVRTENDRDSRVSINLPLRVVTRAMAVLPDDPCRRRCEARFGDADIRMTDLRTIIGSLQQFPNGSVAMRRDDTDLLFRRDGENLVIHFQPWAESPGEVRVPFGLAEAIVSGPRDGANLRAAAGFLEQRGGGELMVVGKDETTVRMWVDGDPSGRSSW